MYVPAISIVLPVYNCAAYIKETIDSLLDQSFGDFELLVMDDGSTDSSVETIRNYADRRIKLFENTVNQGLIFTLNKGINLAQGKYIARMDADDICHRERFYKQLDLFVKDPSISVVATNIVLINQNGEQTGTWKSDLENTSFRQIKSTMPWENCIAHPTVMMKAAIARKYGYNPQQLHTEDYDLWLRILADGLTISKIAEPLLFYRVHEASVTGSILRKSNPFLKQYNCKKTFLRAQVRAHKWGTFESIVLFSTLLDGAKGIAKNVKNSI